jgi:hypothetical protein
MSITAEIHDYIVAVLLRYFRQGRRADLGKPQTVPERDLEILRLHWAVSTPVSNLAEHILNNRHEIQSWLGEVVVADDCRIRGRLLTRETVLARALSGHSTLVVAAEPIRSYIGGANALLLWLIQYALTLARRLDILGPDSSYSVDARRVGRLLERVQRIEILTEARQGTNFRTRPTAASIGQAARSRRTIYRLAYSAYRSLTQIERGDEVEIASTLRATLVAPLKAWQALELALALAIGEALAKAIGAPLTIEGIHPGADHAVFRCGKYRIYWQSRTDAYIAPGMEFSEEVAERVLHAYGMTPGADRPDVVVLDMAEQRVVAVGEAKFYDDEEEGWRAAARAAVDQLIQYCRGYRAANDIEALLSNCVIGLSSRPETLQRAPGTTAPLLASFTELRTGGLEGWARGLTS